MTDIVTITAGYAYVAHATWFVVPDTWHNGTWYMVHRTWYIVHDTRYMVHGTWYMARRTWYMVHVT